MAKKSEVLKDDASRLKNDAGQLANDAGKTAQDLAAVSKDQAGELSSKAKGSASQAQSKASELASAGQERASHVKDNASQKASELYNAGSKQAAQAGQRAGELASAGKDQARNAGQYAGDQASNLYASGQDAARNLKHGAQNLSHEAEQRASDTVAAGRDSVRGAKQYVDQRASDLVQGGRDLVNAGQDRALQARDQAISSAQGAVQDGKDALVNSIPSRKSVLDTFIGTEFSTRRSLTAYIFAFWAATIVRTICLSPSLPVFGPHLAQTLAPIERDDVSWAYIAITRALDLMLALWVYVSEGTKMDAPFLGILLTLISRPTLHQFFHHHFLLGAKTMTEVLITDAAASATALWVLSALIPAPPTFRPAPMIWFKRHFNAPSLQSIGLAFGLGSLLSALIEYVCDRTFLHQMMRAGVMEHLVPAYYATSHPNTAFIQRHPLLPIPTLRSDFRPLNMNEAITRSMPFVSSFLLLSLFVLPQLPNRHLSFVVALLTGPAAFFTLWNLLPVQAWSAGVASVVMASRQAVVAFVMAWVLADLRRPVESQQYEVVKVPIHGRELDGTRIIDSPSKKDL